MPPITLLLLVAAAPASLVPLATQEPTPGIRNAHAAVYDSRD